MAYFQAKIGWKRLRKRKNKNYHSVSFQLNGVVENFKKMGKKIQKIIKYHYSFISSKSRLENSEKGKK